MATHELISIGSTWVTVDAASSTASRLPDAVVSCDTGPGDPWAAATTVGIAWPVGMA